MAPRPPRPPAGSPRGATPASARNGAGEDRLLRISGIVFLATEVTLAYKQMGKMEPKQKAVLKAATHWYEASKDIGDSLGDIKGSYIGLMPYWEGGAADAYQEYIKEDVVPVTERNEATVYEIGNSLVDLHNTVVEFFNAAVTHFGETLSRAIELEGQYQVASEETKGAKRQVLLDTIALFCSGMTTRKVDLNNAVAAQAAAMTKLRGQVLQLRSPGGVPSGVKDPDQWERKE